MSPPEEYLKRWLHPIVFGLWALALIHLIITQRYTAFLRPGFGLLLGLAHFIAMGFMLAAMTRERPAKVDFPSVMRAAVLLLPIVYLMITPDTMLGSTAFKNRFVGNSSLALTRQDRFQPSSRKKAPVFGSLSQPGDHDGAKKQSINECTLLELLLRPDFFRGQRVILTGMIFHDQKLKQYFAGADTAVYRFLVTCCAADAMPLAIAVDSDRTGVLANDQWVRVDGTFELRQINGKQVPVLENAVIQKINAPKSPYLF
jgi:putative membrane protein